MASLFKICILGFLLFLFSCNADQATKTETAEYPEVTQDTTIPAATDSTVTIPEVTSPAPDNKSDSSSTERPLLPPLRPLVSETISTDVLTNQQYGYALVYCPQKMIKGNNSVVTAWITKDVINDATIALGQEIKGRERSRSVEDITSDIEKRKLLLHKKMAVKLDYDEEVFKMESGDDNIPKSFSIDDPNPEWNWDLKPIKTTGQTLLKFTFTGIDENNQPVKLGEKNMYVSVKVDVRSFTSKWMEFLSDDPKYLITTILVPLITFMGGLFVQKKRTKKT